MNISLSGSSMLKALLIVGAGVGVFAASELAANATTINVTGFDDADTPNGICTIREAVRAIVNRVAVDTCPAGNGSSDTILLPTTSGETVIRLSAALTLNRSMTIKGRGYKRARSLLGGLRKRCLNPRSVRDR